MEVDVKKLLTEVPQVSSIEVIYFEYVGKYEYFFKVHGILAKETYEKIIETAKKHGLKFKHLTSAYDCLNLVFEEVDSTSV